VISAQQIREIIAQYVKHGWILRRVLLSDQLRKKVFPEIADFFADAAIEIVSSDVDAAWFSRKSKNREAWELRRLAETPFALFESFDENAPENAREEIRREMENRLRSLAIK
jgi:hypothetical protein